MELGDGTDRLMRVVRLFILFVAIVVTVRGRGSGAGRVVVLCVQVAVSTRDELGSTQV